MIERSILIEGRDPLLFRDGKPSLTSLPMRSVTWPMPSVLAGAIRTRLGANTRYEPNVVDALKAVEHRGPFLAARAGGVWELCFPSPADAVGYDADDGIAVHPLRPCKPSAGEGSNLPHGLTPLFGALERKPTRRWPPFWTARATLDWLARRECTPFHSDPAALGFASLPRQSRVHVGINPTTQVADDTVLFTTDALEFERDGVRFAIVSHIRSDQSNWAALPPVAPLGGERRLAYWSDAGPTLPPPPERLKQITRLRLQLATPAYFSRGWLPGWAETGSPPGTTGLRLKLVSAALPRSVPVSGWSLEAGTRGPKPTRYLAPAGSVYFFDVEAGDPSQLWLRAVSDDPQLCLDGFGLVLCGEWEWPLN